MLSAVPGAETASLVFNADDSALFVTIQHPGEGGRFTDNPRDLISNFPDGPGNPNKPAVLVITQGSGNPVVGSETFPSAASLPGLALLMFPANNHRTWAHTATGSPGRFASAYRHLPANNGLYRRPDLALLTGTFPE